MIDAYYKEYAADHPILLRAAWGYTVETATQCVRLVLSGVFDAHPQLKRRMVQQATHIFGPAGLLEQDDGDNWSMSTRSARGLASRRLGQHLSMGLGHGEVADAGNGARAVEGLVSEHGQRWLYRAWTEWMAARDWADLKANHSPPPTGVI